MRQGPDSGIHRSRTGVAARDAGRREEDSRLRDQQQGQQQPPRRHRSTARRRVSISSWLAYTWCSVPGFSGIGAPGFEQGCECGLEVRCGRHTRDAEPLGERAVEDERRGQRQDAESFCQSGMFVDVDLHLGGGRVPSGSASNRARTCPTTRRTAAHGPHQSAEKCSTIGRPVAVTPAAASCVARSSSTAAVAAGAVARTLPARDCSISPTATVAAIATTRMISAVTAAPAVRRG